MPGPSLKSTLLNLLDRVSTATRAEYDADRRRHPERFTGSPDGLGPNFLYAANVARMLGCNIDFVRRIPRSELPASKVANRLIYARSDVERYILAQRDSGMGSQSRARKLQRVAISPSEKPADDFDPVRFAHQMLTEPKCDKSEK